MVAWWHHDIKNVFCTTALWCRESTGGHWWIPLTKNQLCSALTFVLLNYAHQRVYHCLTGFFCNIQASSLVLQRVGNLDYILLWSTGSTLIWNIHCFIDVLITEGARRSAGQVLIAMMLHVYDLLGQTNFEWRFWTIWGDSKWMG